MFARDDPSPQERRIATRGWPNLLLLPALMGALHATAFSLLFSIFLGEGFGFSGGRPAPWPGAIAGVWLAAFWTTRVLDRWSLNIRMGQAILSVAWAIALLAWIVAEPVYRESRIWSDPGSLVQGNAYLIMPLLISLVIWWQGIRYASDQPALTAEETRATVQRSWLVMGGSILLAIFAVGDNADDALSDARLSVPLLLIVSLALVAAAELETTRRITVRRGGQPPGWERWGRLAGGMSAIVIVVTVIVLTLLGPDLLNEVIALLVAMARLIGIAVGYTIYAVIFAVYQVILGLAWAIEQIFGDVFGPISLPSQPQIQPPTQPQQMFPEQEQTEQWEYAILLRWVVLGLGIAVLAFLLFRIARRFSSMPTEGIVEQERDSVFSADLARRQLRDLLRRGQADDRPASLDLDGIPASVRDVMRYLETLAGRQGVARRQSETSTDFLDRLRAVWLGVAPSLLDLNGRYQRIRYGEYPDTRDGPEYEPSLRDWSEVWRRRKDVPLPQDNGSSDEGPPR